ncbi:unnamed protein product [Didymodactylos carnosus]|uniref:CN hydrolase domain-containing protein n=1 Tax=Didymodactylos carnosus TaxID=1234261 RepID=A0A814BNN7_9BILA|nr:unnamed protein product [Didymodactylos carnosus]CAF0955221.1 unnamed protein product [Didymodactylos carnosus]CAF3706944.1 unnamed protein product [Didymodactylos carnosus]CAF3728612.1 unnamed protein product [Didymodactylos carnosus]
MTTARIAVCQLNSTADKLLNLQIGQQLIRQAKEEQQAQIIFFPEAFDFICENKVKTVEQSESIDGHIMQTYRNLAKQYQIWLSLGGFHQKFPTDTSNRISNNHLLINSDGQIVSQYAKIHLFDVLAGAVQMKESDYVNYGMEIVSPVQTPVGKIGLGILKEVNKFKKSLKDFQQNVCVWLLEGSLKHRSLEYRFAEYARLLTELDAQILTYPSAFTKHTGEAHWEILLRARAIENQCFVVAAAQVGQHSAKRESYGHSLIVDPWGKVLLDLGLDAPVVKTIEIDLSLIKTVREKMPISQQRRRDLYSLVSTCKVPIQSEPIHWGQLTITSSQLIYQSSLSFATVNKKPVVPGHLLVSPFRCVDRFCDLTAEEISDLFTTVKHVAKIIEQHYNAKSFSIAVQDGEFAGQTVKLAHHDKNVKHWRTEEEMLAEAVQLRKLFYSSST